MLKIRRSTHEKVGDSGLWHKFEMKKGFLIGGCHTKGLFNFLIIILISNQMKNDQHQRILTGLNMKQFFQIFCIPLTKVKPMIAVYNYV